MQAILRWIEPKRILPADRQSFSNDALKVMIVERKMKP